MKNFHPVSPQLRRAAQARGPLSLFAVVATTMFMASAAHAIVISEDVFKKNGGDPNNVAGTIATAMEPLRQASYASQFLSVGKLADANPRNDCTATWLGDSLDGLESQFLTAAHCVENWTGKGRSSPAEGMLSLNFTDWAGRTAAGGQARYIMGPYRTNIPTGMGGASTDIALLRMRKTASILDATGTPIPPPVLYDGSEELNKPIWFAGYGPWGAGSRNARDEYLPKSGARRAAGASIVNPFFESDYGFDMPYVPEVGGNTWARWGDRNNVISEDGGSALWQEQAGFWVIAGVLNAGWVDSTTAARVSKYSSWIRQKYPQAQFLSEQYTVTDTHAIVTPNFALDAKDGTIGYVVPQQMGATGPTALIWEDKPGPAFINVSMKDSATGNAYFIKLRAWRKSGCGSTNDMPMNDAISCYGNRAGPLIVSYTKSDNPTLRPGNYRGDFIVQALGYQDKSYSRLLTLKGNITVK